MAGIQFKVDKRIQGEFLKHPERTLPIYEAEFRKGLDESTMLVQREVVNRTPIRTGTLKKSITTEIRGAGLNMHGVIGTPMVYALPVERGAKSHRPPMGPIELWVRRVGMSIEYLDRPLTIRQMAFIIARRIAGQSPDPRKRGGLPAHWMFRDGLAASTTRVLKILSDAQDRILRALGK